MPAEPAEFRIVILGGYGQFGSRIAAALARDTGLYVLIAGRHLDAGKHLCESLRGGDARASLAAIALDVHSSDFAVQLAAAKPHLVIHTAGPFQGRDYRVAEATLAAAAHYIDLADARDFVVGIDVLAAQAYRADRWVVAGASSVPGLSAAVVEAHRVRFASLESVEIAISPGNRTERGLATTRAILGYVGKSYAILQRGRWIEVHGWQSLRRMRAPHVGTRWLARCEVPRSTITSP